MTNQKTEKDSVQRQAVRWLAIFLGVMLAFTFLSRAADSFGIPRVTAEAPTQKMITHVIEADGSVYAKKTCVEPVTAGLLVDSVLVKAGQSVKVGDALFRVNEVQLQEKVDEAAREVETLAAQLADLEGAKSLADQTQARTLLRAQQDYDTTAKNAEQDVNSALTALNEAEIALAQLYAAWENAAQSGQSAQSGQAAQNVQEGQVVQNTQAEQDAQNEDGAGDVAQENDFAQQEAALLAEIAEKKQLYEQACRVQEEALRTAWRSVEDAKQPQAPDSTIAQNRVALDEKRETLQKLQTLQKNGGIVQAKTAGTVTQMLINAGGQTGDAACILADASEGFQYEAQITKEEAAYVAAGDALTLKLSDNTRIEDLTVKEVSVSPEDASVYIVTAEISDAGLIPGARASMRVVRESQKYPLCIPAGGLRSDDTGKFVLVLEQQKTALGDTLTLRRVDVEVLEQNSQYAAIAEGTLNANQQVVITTNRQVDEGSRVRLME